MKSLAALLMIVFLNSCGKEAKDASAPTDGLDPKGNGNRVIQTLSGTSFDGFSYADIPTSMLFAWYPTENYFQNYKAAVQKLGFNDFKSYWEKSVFVTANAAYQTDKLGDELVSKIDNLNLVINKACPEMTKSQDQVGFDIEKKAIEACKADKKEARNKDKSLRQDFGMALNDSLTEIQRFYDPHIDWQNSTQTEQEQQKINVIYPHNDSNYDGYIFQIGEDVYHDSRIVFARFGSDEIKYDSAAGDIELSNFYYSSTGNRVFDLTIHEKNKSGMRTDATIKIFDLEESNVYYLRRYLSSKVHRYVGGQLVREGVFKLELDEIRATDPDEGKTPEEFDDDEF